MPAMTAIPAEFTSGPFHRDDFIEAGLPFHLLRGRRFTRLFPRVWVWAEHEMTHLDWIVAARHAVTKRAKLSHVTRLQLLGLERGPRRPYHLTVQGDLHLDVDSVFVHRTEVMPPCDDDGVTPTAAFIQICDRLSLIDLVAIGDWLLHHGHMTLVELAEVAYQQLWRPGARESLVVMPHLDERARSFPESELRMMVIACGLPVPEVNAEILVEDRTVAIVDLLIRRWMLALEYEGRQHLTDLRQWNRDIGRYADLRSLDVGYLQVTNEMKAYPRALMMTVHQALVGRGYDGPAPVFGSQWNALTQIVVPPPQLGR